MKRKSLFTLLFLAIILFFVGYGAAKLMRQTEMVSFTAAYVEKLTDSGGHVTEHRYIVADKPGASVRVNFSTKADDSECRVRIVLTPSSTTFVVDELMAKSTIYHPLPTTGGTQLTVPNRFTNAGTARSFGYNAVILVAEDKTSRVERWIIPQLNDLAVKDVRHWKDNTGMIVGTTEQTVTELTVGEPDPELFLVPINYREITPSEIEIVLLRDVLQLPQSKLNLDVLRRSDEIYMKSQIYK